MPEPPEADDLLGFASVEAAALLDDESADEAAVEAVAAAPLDGADLPLAFADE